MAAPAAPPKDLLTTYQSLVSTFADFLIVAIHTILFERSIYPVTTFISTRKYNFPVRQNRHPKVCQWINDAVAAVESEIVKGVVDRVAFVIYSPDAKVLERFMFDLSSFPRVPLSEVLTPFDDADLLNEKETTRSISITDVEEQLRATVRKLAYCGSKLGELPPDCTYTIAVELKESGVPPIGHPQPWVPSVPPLQTGDRYQSDRIGNDLGGVKTVPVRAVEAGEFVLDTWIEEGKSKFNR